MCPGLCSVRDRPWEHRSRAGQSRRLPLAPRGGGKTRERRERDSEGFPRVLARSSLFPEVSCSVLQRSLFLFCGRKMAASGKLRSCSCLGPDLWGPLASHRLGPNLGVAHLPSPGVISLLMFSKPSSSL